MLKEKGFYVYTNLEKGDNLENINNYGDIVFWKCGKKIEIEISCIFLIFGNINDFEIDNNNCKIIGKNFINNSFHISIIKKVSEKLYNEFKLYNSPRVFLGFISNSLVYINDEIFKQKLKSKNLLLKQLSMLDIQRITINNPNIGNGCKEMKWLISISDFQFYEDYNNFYFDNLLDGIYLYFYWDFTNSIIKLITSIEEFLKKNILKGEYKIVKGKKKISNTFKSKIKNNFPKNNKFEELIENNIYFLYDIRNKIVHNGKIILYDKINLNKLVLSTIYFFQIIKEYLGDKNYKEYYELSMNFQLVDEEINGIELDKFKYIKVKNQDEINEIMYQKLKIEKNFKENSFQK